MRTFLYACLLLSGAGVIAGASFFQLFAALLGACLSEWMLALWPLRHETVFVTLDPASPNGERVLDAFRLALDRVASVKRAVRLRISNPESGHRARFSLTLARTGDLLLRQEGQRDRPLGLPNRWIADHPVPLLLPNATSTTLFFAPTESDRVRVSLVDREKRPLALLTVLAGLTLAALLTDRPMIASFLTGALLAHVLISLKTVPTVRKSNQRLNQKP